MYDIIIIGAGPAGLTAAIYAKRANKNILVLEANTYGGQIINTSCIDNYPVEPHISGFDYATKLYNQVKELDVEVKFEKVNNIEDGLVKKVITNNNVYQTKSIILASGLKVKQLGLPNEEELTGKGISYCATCDGAFYKGKTVAVVGGGNTAVEDALYLSDIASKVYIIHRKSSFKAEEVSINKLKEKDNVEFIYNSNIVIVEKNDALNIKIKDNNDNYNSIIVDGLFIAIGRIPDNNFCSSLIDLDEKGYIKAVEDCKTNIDGIFVAGDIRTKEVRQLVTATSDGAIAALNAIKYINNK